MELSKAVLVYGVGPVIGWFVGSWLGRRARRGARIFLTEFCKHGIYSFPDGGIWRVVRQGYTRRYIIIDEDGGHPTRNAKKAAQARALGKDVYLHEYECGPKSVQFISTSLSHPAHGYNFMTETFEHLQAPKESYVQLHKS